MVMVGHAGEVKVLNAGGGGGGRGRFEIIQSTAVDCEALAFVACAIAVTGIRSVSPSLRLQKRMSHRQDTLKK